MTKAGKMEVRARSRKEAFERVRNLGMLKGHYIPLKATPTKFEVTYRHSLRKKSKQRKKK